MFWWQLYSWYSNNIVNAKIVLWQVLTVRYRHVKTVQYRKPVQQFPFKKLHDASAASYLAIETSKLASNWTYQDETRPRGGNQIRQSWRGNITGGLTARDSGSTKGNNSDIKGGGFRNESRKRVTEQASDLMNALNQTTPNGRKR